MSKSDSQTADKAFDDLTLESMGAHMFFGPVDNNSSYDACQFILKSNMFYKEKRALTMFFNTGGGEASDGFAVIDLMETSRLPIATVGIGTICSMGVLLISAGNHGMRTLTKNAEVMAHQFSGYFDGKQHELLAQQTAHKMLERRFIRHFLNHSTMSEAKIRDILFSPTDRYLTPLECKKFGLVDRVVEFADVPATLTRAPTKKLVNQRSMKQ